MMWCEECGQEIEGGDCHIDEDDNPLCRSCATESDVSDAKRGE